MNTLSQKLQARVLSVLTLFSFVITTYATSYVIFSSTIQDAHAANIVVTEGSTPYLFSDMFGWTKASPEDGDAGSTDYGLTVNDDEINGYTWSENGGYISFDGLYGPSLIESGSDLTTFDPNMFEAKVSVNTGHTADIYGYAYSSEMGWLSLNCDQTAYSGGTNTCGSVDYGVNISSAGSFGGYAYAENGAWVSFDGGSGSGAFVLETTWKPNVAPSNSLVLGYGFSGVWVNTSENIYASTTDLDNDDIQASFTVSGMTVAYTGVFVGSQVSSGNNSELTLPALSDGIYTFLATVSDVPSNGAGVFTTNESTYGGSIQIDTTEPASPSLSVSPNNWSTGSVYTVSVTNPSDLSGINQYFYKVGTPTSANDYTSSGSVSSSVGGASTDVDVTIATEDQIVYFWLSDIAGNVGYSDKTSIDLQRDVTAPGLPSYTTTEDVWYDTAPTINLDVTDSHDLGVVSYAIDGTGSWTQITDLSGSDETTTNLDLDLTADFGALSNAFHTVYFKITDEAGNETITTTEQSFVFGKQYDESNIVDVVISDSATTPSDNTDIATINPSITLTQQSDISLYAYATDAYGNYWDITNTGSWAVTTANTNTPAPSLIDGLYGAGGAEGGNLADTLTYTYEALSDTQTVTVTPGELSSITILTADNNGGEAFSSHTMTTDDTVTLYVAGYNASGSYWGAPSVSWSSDFSGLHGTDSVVTNGSLFSFEPTKVQSGTISVSHSGGTFTDTIDGTITVNIGALDHVHIFEESVDPWTLSEFGSTGITADQSIALKSAGFDSDNNFIDYESVDWSASAVIGSSFSVVSGTGTVFNGTISDQGVGIITADHATATDDTTGNITVADGAVSQIRVQSSDQNSALTNSTNYYGLSIPQLDTVDMDTDTAVSFYSNAYDSDNNYISSIDTDWVLDSGNLESQEPEYIFETGNEFAFDADVANKSGILRSETGALSDLTNTITVNPGSLDNVKILVGTSGGGTELGIHSMDTDQSTSLVLHAAGYDADDNYRGTDESVTWTMVDSLGNENNRGNFGSSDADTQTSSVAVSVEFFADITTGSGLFIKAAHATATDDTTGGITITDGVLASIALESPSGTGVVAGNDLDLHAVGYDADGNIKPSLDDGNTSDILFSWSILGDQAYESINNTGLFTAGESGTRTVQATQDGVTQTLDIVVTPAALNSISITPVDATVAQSDSITFTTEGFDQYGNTRGDYTSSASYVTTTDSSGSWASNVYTASANDVGNIYVVRTAVDSFTSDTSLSITNGVLDYVLIEDAPSEDGSEIASLTGYTADDTVTLYAVGYTSANDYWGNVPVTWTVTDSAGEFSSNGGNSTTFSFNSTGTYTITATPASVTADSVSTVSVDHGTIVSMDIIPSSTGVIAGTSVAYTATAQDNNGNTWDITDTASYVLSDLSAGHWTSTGTVLMEKSGLYTVTSSLSGISDTATITVDHAAVTSTGLTLTPSSASTDADTSFQYTLNANDAYGNTWDV
ncbi:MAG: hypothetical protein U9Q15_00200 [Patescibacteria group bacterium]|nr:hypothetical protein [Patescibacteria group bacterium]